MTTTTRRTITITGSIATAATAAVAIPILGGTALHQAALYRAGEANTMASIFAVITLYAALLLVAGIVTLARQLGTAPETAAAEDSTMSTQPLEHIIDRPVYDQEKDTSLAQRKSLTNA